MKSHNYAKRCARGLLLAAIATSFAAAQAGEVPAPNAFFNADAAGWYWENWSAAGSSVAFDGALNLPAPGSAQTSGSLKVVSAFNGNPGYQQAVFTVPLPAAQDFTGQVGAISFDVRVDPGSTARAGGDYGWLEIILRQGNEWTWVGLPGVRLNGNEWQRVTFQLPKSGIDSIRAFTLKLGENDFLGPVTLNVDNVSFLTNPDDVWITGADNGNVDGWSWENWSVTGIPTFDSMDVSGRSTSGSIRLEQQFAESPGTYQQSVFTYVLPSGTVDATAEYSYLNLDVKVDPSSVKRANGDYGYWEVILRNGNGWDWIGTQINGANGISLTDNDWHHLSFKVPTTANAVHRLTFKTGQNALLGPVILNVDNITWTRNTAPPPPPTIGIAAAAGGLTLVHTSSDIYGRHNIYTTESAYNFAGSAEPVSYSFTVGSYPKADSNPGFQAHIFLVPGNPGNETSPDWNEPTLIFMDIKNAANGAGNATFRIKTDQAGGNSELYAAGATTVNSASVVGKWTLTYTGNNTFTMTAPDGTVSAPIDIGGEAAALFGNTGDPLRVYFGVQGNNDANKGQSVKVSKVEIKQGANVLITDDFSGDELDTAKWTANATAGGVLFVPSSDAGYMLNWTLPDTGFKVRMSPSLTTPNWTDVDMTAAVSAGPIRQLLVPKSALPAGGGAFFQLLKPAP